MEHYRKAWRFASEAHNGSGGFANGDYIDQYPRESEEKYERRKEIAYYVNLFSSKVHRYIGYLFRNAPVRSSSNKLLSLMFDDADAKGNTMDVFMSGFATEAKVRGAGLVLVDMPKDIPGTLKEQIEQRAVPYLVLIEPERLDGWGLDRFGRFTWVEFSDTITDPDDPDKEISVTRRYDTDGWSIKYRGDIIEQGEHRLGKCPVLPFGEKGDFPAVGEFTKIAGIAKRHYNLKSELDEILRSQTFSLLTIQGDPSKLDISTNNALSYPLGAERPDFIAPPSTPADTYQDEIRELERSIDRIAYDTSTSEAAESGISLQIKFQGLNGSLANFAMRLEDLEARIYEIAAAYLGVENDVTVSYPREFHIIDTEKELATLQALKDLGYNLPKYEAMKLTQIIQNDLGGVEHEKIAEIVAEIEDGLKVD